MIEILESYKPELIDRFKANVQRTFDNIREALGPDFKNVYNDWTWAKAFSNVVKPYFNTADHTLIESKLAEGAERYADDTIKAWQLKIESKLGDLDDGEVHHLNGCAFNISGTKAGHKVYIEQQMIINVSSKGTLFNQFPARIKLDGKPISAKKFREKFTS